MLKLILLATFSVAAQATPIKVHLYSTTGPFALTQQRADELFGAASGAIRDELGVDLIVTKRRVMKDRFKTTHCLSETCRLARLNKWQNYFQKRNKKKSILKVLILPPIIDGDKRYIAGYASATCAYRNSNPVMYVNAQEYNQDGVPRFLQAAHGLAHEMLHLIGGKHLDTEPNVMHGNTMALVEPPAWLPILAATKESVGKCIGKPL